MKKIVKILLIAVFLLVVVAGVSTYFHNQSHSDVPVLDEYTTVLGSNSNGTVYKIECGNNSSDDTVVVILGVHSLESGIHNATNETIMKYTKDNTLSKRYIVYFIKLNFKNSGQNISDYDTNRHMGELLANEYVVPDIENYNPYLVIDVHEMESYWDEQKYVGVLDNKSDISMEYANTIANNLSYPIFTINAGTSPKWVTVPISKKGHEVILFETPQKDKQSTKLKTADTLVRTIDSLNVYI